MAFLCGCLMTLLVSAASEGEQFAINSELPRDEG